MFEKKKEKVSNVLERIVHSINTVSLPIMKHHVGFKIWCVLKRAILDTATFKNDKDSFFKQHYIVIYSTFE